MLPALIEILKEAEIVVVSLDLLILINELLHLFQLVQPSLNLQLRDPMLLLRTEHHILHINLLPRRLQRPLSSILNLVKLLNRNLLPKRLPLRHLSLHRLHRLHQLAQIVLLIILYFLQEFGFGFLRCG